MKTAHQRHSDTSREAAQQIEPKTPSLQVKVLGYLRQKGAFGATDEEMQRSLAMNPSTQRPRRIELCNLGLVSKTDIKRKTTSGRRAAVWVAKQ